MRNKRWNLTFLITGCTSLVLSPIFVFRQHDLLQLAFMGLSLFIAVSTLVYFVSVTEKKIENVWYNWVNFLVPFLCVMLGIELGQTAKKSFFEHYIPELEQIIEAQTRDAELIWNHAKFEVMVDENGEKTAYLWWGRGFPVKHSVFAYHPAAQEDARPILRELWPRLGAFAKNWWWVGT